MPFIEKHFETATVSSGAVLSLHFSIINDDGTPKTGVGFTDTLPAGMTVATPNGLVNGNGLSGITAVEGSGSISVSGASLAGGEQVFFSVNVTVAAAGEYINTTSNLTTTEDGTIADSFSTASIIVLDQSSALRWILMRLDIKTREEEEA